MFSTNEEPFKIYIPKLKQLHQRQFYKSSMWHEYIYLIVKSKPFWSTFYIIVMLY